MLPGHGEGGWLLDVGLGQEEEEEEAEAEGLNMPETSSFRRQN